MSIDYEKLKDQIFSFIKNEIKEGRLDGTPEEVYQRWYSQIKEKLRIAGDNAIMRMIANTKCGIEVYGSIEQVDVGEMRKKVKIKDMSLALKKKSIELVARVSHVEFGKTRKGTKYCAISLSDGTGTVIVNFWKEEAEQMKNFPVGKVVHVRGYIDDPYNKNDPFDFKMGKYGHIEPVEDEDASNIPEFSEVTIKDIKTNKPKHADLTCKIIKKYDLGTTKAGKSYASFAVSDVDGDQINVKIFDDVLAVKFQDTINEGDTVLLQNFGANVFKNMVSLQNNWDKSAVKKVDVKIELPDVEYKGRGASAIAKPLADAKDGDNIKFIGTVTRLYATKPYYDMCPIDGCMKGVTDGNCKAHGEITGDPIPRPRLNGQISDGDTALRFSMMGEIVERMLGMNANTIKTQSDSMNDQKSFIEAFIDKMQGKWYEVTGNVKLDKDYRGDLDIMVNTMDEIDFEIKTRSIVEEIKNALA